MLVDSHCHLNSTGLAEQQGDQRLDLIQPLVGRIDRNQYKIGNDSCPNRHEAQAKRQRNLQHPRCDGNCDQLATDRHPAQQNKRLQPQPVAAFGAEFGQICCVVHGFD